MIGPLAHGQSFLSTYDFLVAPTAPAVRLISSDGSVAVARSTSGIVTISTTIRGKLITPPSTDGWYIPLWDDSNGTPGADDQVLVSTILTDILAAGGGGGGGGTPLPLIGDANGELLGKTFLIKRNDTRPYLRRQLINEATGTPVDLSSITSLKFTMRRTGTNVSPDTGATTPKVHADAVVITTGGLTAADGVVEYRWTASDTNQTTDGAALFVGEFEVTFSDNTVETFPQSDYITISIPVDLDPGINP